MKKKEYISKEKVLEHLQKIQKDKFVDSEYKKCAWALSLFIETLLDSDVHTVNHGKWRTSKSCGVLPTNSFVCSECDGLVIVSTYRNRCLYNYCPNCGAKMDGD